MAKKKSPAQKKARIPDYPIIKADPEDGITQINRYLNAVVHDYEKCQKIRIAFDNQIKAFSTTNKDRRVMSRFIAYRDQMYSMEKVLYAHACEYLLDHPISEWLLGIPGMGVVTAMKLLGCIPMYTENDFCTVSKLYKFCGLVPRVNKTVPGQKRNYNKRIKVALHNFWRAMLVNEKSIRKLGSDVLPQRLYIDTYKKWFNTYQERQKYKDKKDQWSETHCKYAAKIKMCTLLISHLWQVWREALGFPVKRSYVHEVLQHKTFYPPIEFSSSKIYEMKYNTMRTLVRKTFKNRELASQLWSMEEVINSIEGESDINDLKDAVG